MIFTAGFTAILLSLIASSEASPVISRTESFSPAFSGSWSSKKMLRSSSMSVNQDHQVPDKFESESLASLSGRKWKKDDVDLDEISVQDGSTSTQSVIEEAKAFFHKVARQKAHSLYQASNMAENGYPADPYNSYTLIGEYSDGKVIKTKNYPKAVGLLEANKPKLEAMKERLLQERLSLAAVGHYKEVAKVEKVLKAIQKAELWAKSSPEDHNVTLQVKYGKPKSPVVGSEQSKSYRSQMQEIVNHQKSMLENGTLAPYAAKQ